MIDLSPAQSVQLPNLYEVLQFKGYLADGNANMQPVAGAPSFDLAKEAVKQLGLKHYAIRVCVFLDTRVPMPTAAPAVRLDG